MAANFRFVAHPAQRHPHELAIGGAGDGPPQRGFAHARRSDQAQDRPLELARPLLDGQIFENPLLDLFQAVMIGFQNRLGRRQILMDLGALLPGYADQPVDIVAHHGRLGRHRRHHLQLAQLRLGLDLGFLRHPGLFDALGQLLDFVGRILQIAEFLLNRLHLFVQIILALAFLHLLLDPAANALFDLQDVDLAFHQGQQMLEAFAQILDLQDFLLLVQLERHVGGDSVGQPTGIIDAGDRGQHLAGDFLVELDVLVEGIEQRAHQRLDFLGRALVQHRLQQRDFGDETGLGFGEAMEANPLATFHQDLDRAVRQPQQLQHVRQGTDSVDIAGLGVVHLGAALSDQYDAFVALHRQVERMDGLFTADKQRDDHVRVHHHVAERQYRHQCVTGQTVEVGFFLLHGGHSAVKAGRLNGRRRPDGSVVRSRRQSCPAARRSVFS